MRPPRRCVGVERLRVASSALLVRLRCVGGAFWVELLSSSSSALRRRCVCVVSALRRRLHAPGRPNIDFLPFLVVSPYPPTREIDFRSVFAKSQKSQISVV